MLGYTLRKDTVRISARITFTFGRPSLSLPAPYPLAHTSDTATEFIATGPEGAVEFGFLNRHVSVVTSLIHTIYCAAEYPLPCKNAPPLSEGKRPQWKHLSEGSAGRWKNIAQGGRLVRRATCSGQIGYGRWPRHASDRVDCLIHRMFKCPNARLPSHV